MEQLTTFLVLSIIVTSVVTSTMAAKPGPGEVCLLVPPDVEECYQSFQGKPISTLAAQVACLQQLLWNFSPNRTLTDEDVSKNYISNSLHNLPRDGGARFGNSSNAFSITRFGFRSEYRTLTPDQRRRFHDAMNVLYRDGTIGRFARLHNAAVGPHHGHPSFLPWHRVMLSDIEQELRNVDPSVSLPYLDTTLDFNMDNPVNSIIWSPEYLGGGFGAVRDGPFAGWVTDQGRLERFYGRSGRPFRRSDIDSTLSRCRLEEISRPRPVVDFELFHGGFHVWVGGEMAVARTAAWDPVFYMHHAYVDYVWELFRRRQRNTCNVDPTTDYPQNSINLPLTGFPNVTIRDAISDIWIRDYYDYNDAPSCPVCCPGCVRPEPIYCDTRRNVCVSASRRSFPRSMANLSRSDALAMNSEFLSEIERAALERPSVPRNRGGRPFDSPPNDGRTLETALLDAVQAANRREAPATGTGRTSGDRRTGPIRDLRPDRVVVDGRRSPNRLRETRNQWSSSNPSGGRTQFGGRSGSTFHEGQSGRGGRRSFDGPTQRRPNRIRSSWR